jgi:hypothetical protein
MKSSVNRMKWMAVVGAVISFGAQAGPLEFPNRAVALFSSPTPTSDCLYFTLQGVPQADPGVPNQPWFAVPRTHQGFKEIAMIVAMAKASERSITVRTGTTFACGFISVDYVYLH